MTKEIAMKDGKRGRANCIIRRTLAFSTIAMIAAGCADATPSQPDPLLRQLPAWKRLDLSGGNRITGMRLILLNDGPFGEERPPTFDERIKDSAIMKLVERGFEGAVILVPREERGVTGVRRIGRLVCTTTKGVTDVTITSTGFLVAGIEGQADTYQNFYSPELAYTLAAILEAQQLPPLTEKDFASLTGEHYLRACSTAIQKEIAATPSLKP